MAAKQQRIPEEIEERYQFIGDNAYRVYVDPEIIMINGRPGHQLKTANCGPKEKVINTTEEKEAPVPPEIAPTGHQINKKPVTPRSTSKSTTPADVTVKTTDEMLQKIMALQQAGYTTTRAIAKMMNVSHMTIARKLAGQKELF